MQPDIEAIECSVSEFVALCNQTFEYAFPSIVITGELANLRVSKNRWVYFDLKDEDCTVKFFGTVYQLPGPLEDGMILKVRGQPRLHNKYGFSVNVQNIQPAGEGTIKRAAQLLQAKLQKEGLFDESRKRPTPYPPKTIGLVASKQSAAYADFIKIINARWQGIDIQFIDVQVQGEVAPTQIAAALEQFNSEAEPPEVIVLIRGGGSPEDLAAFSSELVTRAVAASRAPTLVAIGHEIDLSLAELAADLRASTPSNAAELLVPDKKYVLGALKDLSAQLADSTKQIIKDRQKDIATAQEQINQVMASRADEARSKLGKEKQLLNALSPTSILKRGYAIVRNGQSAVRSANELVANDIVNVELAKGSFAAKVTDITEKKAA